MRIAWLGPAPTMGGGVPQVGTLIIEALAELGHRIDCFTVPGADPVPSRIADHPLVTVVGAGRDWRWDRWYSRGGASLLTVLTEQGTRARAQHRLLADLLARHRREPYSVVYQFSQWELLGLRRARSELPPIVLHPQVHAGGELRWHRREDRLSRVCEPRARTLAVRQMLRGRAVLQRRDARSVDGIVAASAVFAADLRHDYGVPPARLHVVPNPVDLVAFRDGGPGGSGPGSPVEILYVSRFSVRKGLEMVVDLTHRLADLEGSVHVRVVGHTSLWSDYRDLLRDLHPGVGVLHGQADASEMPALHRAADLVVQPSHYEPFGLTVAEALASGTPVVASDRVGATAGVDPSCCRVFPSGDANAFEREVRLMIQGAAGGAAASRRTARAEAQRLFDARRVGAAVAEALERARRPVTLSDVPRSPAR